jgi:hypothetical protein
MKKRSPLSPPPAQSQPTLTPNGLTSHSSRSVKERQKHPRLNGADLYVARLGWCKEPPGAKKKSKSAAMESDSIGCNLSIVEPVLVHSEPSSSSSSSSSLSSSSCSSSSYGDSDVDLSLTSPISSISSGCLHDELLDPHPRPSHLSTPPTIATADPKQAAIHASRPCYRCVTYMNSVGIRRVFWTNEGGVWEGGKVRDLVDALNGSGGSTAGKDEEGEGTSMGGPLGNGVFVTKHEVLMLRRMMGRKK